LSGESRYEPGKAIRGGIPISWPWFADHPSDSTKPAHGFARTSLWKVTGTQHISTDETEITMVLNESPGTHKLWDYSFDLELKVLVGAELSVVLKMTNTGEEAFTVTSAFHSYYNVGNITQVEIHGLEDTEYIDKVDKYTKKRQSGPVTIAGETDRIFLDTETECIIKDLKLNRNMRISKSGSKSTVVWNPWSDKSQKMGDLPDDGYKNFVCVESANAGPDINELAPGEQHELGLKITVENM
jgi:D-hexose-6-phosphate mutarotase